MPLIGVSPYLTSVFLLFIITLLNTMMVIKTAKCQQAFCCAEIYWLTWILLGLSVITLQLKALSLRAFEEWGGPMETEPKTCSFKAHTQG